MARPADGRSDTGRRRREGGRAAGSRAAAVERRLRRLDAAACGALVADLWAARGFETRRADGVVVATRRGESRVVYPLPRSRVGSPPPPDRPVDVVVDPRGRRVAHDVAAAHGARVVDAAALREALFYGVDRETAADLCERHLGARPADIRPPLVTRLRERAAAVPSAGTAVPVGLVVVLVVGALVTAGATGFADGPTEPGGDGAGGAAPIPPPAEARVGDARTAETPTARPSWPTSPATVPGLDGDGIEDPGALAAAHERALRNRSYTLWVDYSGPDEGGTAGSRTRFDTDIAVDGRQYLAVTSAEGGDDVAGDGREVRSVVYHDGDERYVATSTARDALYRRAGEVGGRFDSTGPDASHRTLVLRYLVTDRTDVTGRVELDGRSHYRIVGRGAPAGRDRRVRNYTAVALVGPEGFVRDLTVRYTVDIGRPAEVRREWTYGRVGETTVEPPAWYERPANATGTPARGAGGDE